MNEYWTRSRAGRRSGGVRALVTVRMLGVLLAAGVGAGEPTAARRGADREPVPGFRLPTPAFQTEVPARPVDLLLGRPTRDSITLSVLAHEDLEGQVVWGPESGPWDSELPRQALAKGRPVELVLRSRWPGARHRYEFRWCRPGEAVFRGREEGGFTTARPPGSPFTFTVQADPHLDFGTDLSAYRRSLTNALAARTDFHVDLGDTFMVDKYGDFRLAVPHYLAQRHYLGMVGRHAPVFLVLGNHDGEFPARDGRGAASRSAWSNTQRKTHFPNPRPDGFYEGNRVPDPELGLLEDYYAWEWGDALFLVLDPFWYSARSRRDAADNWARTLGADQYRWLERVLARSRARFRFVFIHHLVGGDSPEGRGGAEASRYFEWGGHELDGRRTFAEKRPGWPLPIHDLLVKHGVSVVFHGHDHFYACQERDGVVYQLVPQPGHVRYDNLRSAAEYGYRSGVLHGAAGILRVAVAPEQAVVEYVRAYPAEAEARGLRSGAVTHRYTVTPGRK